MDNRDTLLLFLGPAIIRKSPSIRRICYNYQLCSLAYHFKAILYFTFTYAFLFLAVQGNSIDYLVRDGFTKKSCCSFGFCPNYLPPIWTTCTTFLNAKNVDLSDIQNDSLSKIILKLRQNTCFVGHPARVRSARARRACALRALGLFLADGAPTVGRGKTC